ncbi:DegT/DnrJ/EryC1/StrS family aminotransferase [Thermodesulfobacteriota bacterium]
MQFIDLNAQQKRIRENIETNIKTVLDHGRYIMGPEVQELENKLAEYVGVKHAISCASGTDALLMALMAYDIGPGDAVFTTPFTFIATAEVISLLGATPIFVDIDPKTFNIDPEKLNKAITALKDGDPNLHPLPLPRGIPQSGPPKEDSTGVTPHASRLTPKGIIAIDLFGLPADYDRIKAIAKKHDLFVIEDAAQSFGGEYKGKKTCSLTDIGCTSFFPAKPLGCYGDGGMCFTDDDSLAALMQSVRVHGKGTHKYDNSRIGLNGRLDTIQAAILLAKFEIFPEEVELRNQVAQQYSDLLLPLSSSEALLPPQTPSNARSVWAQYSVLAKDEKHRGTIQAKLKDEGVPTAIYYPKPLHMQTAFESLGYKVGDFPISEDFANRIFSLPMHPYLTSTQQEKIVKVLGEV